MNKYLYEKASENRTKCTRTRSYLRFVYSPGLHTARFTPVLTPHAHLRFAAHGFIRRYIISNGSPRVCCCWCHRRFYCNCTLAYTITSGHQRRVEYRRRSCSRQTPPFGSRREKHFRSFSIVCSVFPVSARILHWTRVCNVTDAGYDDSSSSSEKAK